MKFKKQVALVIHLFNGNFIGQTYFCMTKNVIIIKIILSKKKKKNETKFQFYFNRKFSWVGTADYSAYLSIEASLKFRESLPGKFIRPILIA